MKKIILILSLILILVLAGCKQAPAQSVSEEPSNQQSEEASEASEEPKPESVSDQSEESIPQQSEATPLDMNEIKGKRWEYLYEDGDEKMVVVISFEDDENMIYINGIANSGSALFASGEYKADGNIIETGELFDARLPDKVVFEGSFSIEPDDKDLLLTPLSGMPIVPGLEGGETLLFTLQ